ncbi:hypothetical protein FN846DRAFT_149243 [Sphaerosporella brunnea]|uniref:Uncharacterized protein n=1 Tax=Sphaerosporella brunnea TaxID=1250544 RepID=A0A5J5EQK3_9PEZI|nr:hypothetical protein FN846DRAFT_149243 [Sphaerosporella brunnea]
MHICFFFSETMCGLAVGYLGSLLRFSAQQRELPASASFAAELTPHFCEASTPPDSLRRILSKCAPVALDCSIHGRAGGPPQILHGGSCGEAPTGPVRLWSKLDTAPKQRKQSRMANMRMAPVRDHWVPLSRRGGSSWACTRPRFVVCRIRSAFAAPQALFHTYQLTLIVNAASFSRTHSLQNTRLTSKNSKHPSEYVRQQRAFRQRQ